MNDEIAELEDFGKRWVEAELARDVVVLDALTHKDFILVGPLGFVLDKAQCWTAMPTRTLLPPR